ncbi:glutamate--tRNA ligase [Candidatus Woesearchaeota archaeon]|nr:glutamate--tRNA ligase [Candidatus Woesearchaeota archaeon]
MKIPEDKIYIYALANAVKYHGKPNQGAVLGKMLSEYPPLKQDMKALGKAVFEIVSKVGRISVEAQRKELEKLAPALLEEKHEEQKIEVPALKNAVSGKVVMRLAPSPSGPLHIGHAYVLALNSELAKKYHGKLLLRLEDTNPENLDPQAYTMIPEDANWLTGKNVQEVFIQSERLPLYYEHAEKIIKMGNAYICTCDSEEFHTLLIAGKACPCRELSAAEHLSRWKKMFNEYKPGDAVMRIKTDLQHPNPAMRDWPAFRINESPHPHMDRKYKVWPLMNFAVAVDDHLLGITHTVRGKDHMDNEKRQKYLFDYFGWKPPTHAYVGRINFEGFDLSTTQTRKKIENKEYLSWDDIRLPFLRAFKRRGYQPEAFVQFALGMGLHESDKTVSQEEFYKLLNHYNKEIIDPAANRYFLVFNPVEVKVIGAPQRDVHLLLHPNDSARGERIFTAEDRFYLNKDDVDKLQEDRLHRLMDCLNFTKEGKKFLFHSQDYDPFREAKNKGLIMHYLPVRKDLVPVEVLLPNGTTKKGFGEPELKKLKIGDIIQAERFGFVRLDAINNGVYSFWFTHK